MPKGALPSEKITELFSGREITWWNQQISVVSRATVRSDEHQRWGNDGNTCEQENEDAGTFLVVTDAFYMRVIIRSLILKLMMYFSLPAARGASRLRETTVPMMHRCGRAGSGRNQSGRARWRGGQWGGDWRRLEFEFGRGQRQGCR